MEESDTEDLGSSSFSEELRSREKRSARSRPERMAKRRKEQQLPTSSRQPTGHSSTRHPPEEQSAPRRIEGLWLDAEDSDNFSGPGFRSRPKTSQRPATSRTQMGDIFMSPLSDASEEEEEEANMSGGGGVAHGSLSQKRSDSAELEKHLMQKVQSGFPSLEGLDLSPLIKRLIPAIELREDDKQWTWDNLISSVASKLPLDVEHEDRHDSTSSDIIFH